MGTSRPSSAAVVATNSRRQGACTPWEGGQGEGTGEAGEGWRSYSLISSGRPGAWGRVRNGGGW